MDIQLVPSPELFFGLVAPVGVDLDSLDEILVSTLDELGYASSPLRITKLMREIPIATPVSSSSSKSIDSYKERISYANEVRNKLGDTALAELAISAIRTIRADEWGKQEIEVGGSSSKAPEESPLPRHAYIIRQLKRPEEIALLRSVYGQQFVLISAFAPQSIRIRRIEDAERTSSGGLSSKVDAHTRALGLIMQDENEAQDVHGQNVRDAFPLGDIFIDATSSASIETTLRRFLHLLFGNNQITPTHDEYGMYLAKSASLRSSDLSRQVGAALFAKTGEIISLGCNEVPRAGGGTYWCDDQADKRDFVVGNDPNDLRKFEILVDLLERLRLNGQLSEALLSEPDATSVARKLIDDPKSPVASSKLMDILEFGRIIHAEMSAICDAARKGIETAESTLFTTTFPCHLCAKHIVATGVRRLVYLEPYPKSYATDLHGDSIDIDGSTDTKVRFEPFIGVSPFRYRNLFEKGKRKYGGLAQKWHKGKKRPMIEVFYPSYFEAETRVVAGLQQRLEGLQNQSAAQTPPP